MIFRRRTPSLLIAVCLLAAASTLLFALRQLATAPAPDLARRSPAAAAPAAAAEGDGVRALGMLSPERASILVAVLSGGSNETLQHLKKYKHLNYGASAEREANRAAIMATWGPLADLTLFATAEQLPEGAHRLRLPKALESGGREGLPRKVQGMWAAIAQRGDLDAYGWYIKVGRASRPGGAAAMRWRRAGRRGGGGGRGGDAVEAGEADWRGRGRGLGESRA